MIAPVTSAGWVTLVVREFEGKRPDKTGVFDNSIPIDKPGLKWLWPQLLIRKKQLKSPASKMFAFTMEEFRREFQAAGRQLNLDPLRPYQLRHGGATEDLSSMKREYNAVKSRGRWGTDSSIRRARAAQQGDNATASILQMGRQEHVQSGPRVDPCTHSVSLLERDILTMSDRPRVFGPEIFAVALRAFLGQCIPRVVQCILLILVCFPRTMFCFQLLSKRFAIGFVVGVFGGFGSACLAPCFHGQERIMAWGLDL